jgi:photosystem II stability/assembly factor-like uncharacterized protein
MSAANAPQVVVVEPNGARRAPRTLDARGLTLGREPDNDLALAEPLVSRHHARIDWDGARVTVTDLGSSNGTSLGDARLLPNVPQEWTPGVWLRAGSFFLGLEAPDPAQTIAPQPAPRPSTAPDATTNPNPVPVAVPTGPAGLLPPPPPASNRIRVGLEQNTLQITPGQPAVVRVTIVNTGAIVDHWTVSVEGVPASWVKGPPAPTQLNPGAQATVVLTVLVARAPENRSGEYPVTIRARSRENPQESGAEVALWNVLPFAMSGFAIEPARAISRGAAKYTLTLRNDSNTTGQYQFTGRDDEQALRYRFGQPLVTLEPAGVANVPLTVEAPRRLVGGAVPRRFTIQATEAAGGAPPQTANGELVHKGLLPVWAPAVALAVVLAAGFFIYKQLNKAPSVDLSPDGEIAIVTNGQQTLTWDTKHAQKLRFQPDLACDPYGPGTNLPESGSCFLNLDKNPSLNTPGPHAIKLKADGRSASSSDTITLTVKEPAPDQAVIQSFQASAPQVNEGAPVTLSWAVANAKQVSLSVNGAEIALDPAQTSYQDTPKVDTIYTLSINNGGTPEKRSAKVTVIPAATAIATAGAAPTPAVGQPPVGQTAPVDTNATMAAQAAAATASTMSNEAGMTATSMAAVTPTPMQTAGDGSPLVLDGQPIETVLMGDPAGKILYAVAGTRLFRSDDGGRTWDTQTMRTKQPGQLAVAFNNPDVLYASDRAQCGQTSNAPMSLSIDGGQTWDTDQDFFFQAMGIRAFLLADGNPGIAIGADCQPEYSPDGGNLWLQGQETVFTNGFAGPIFFDILSMVAQSPLLNTQLAITLNFGGSCADGGQGKLQIYDISDSGSPFQLESEQEYCGRGVVAWDGGEVVLATDNGVLVGDNNGNGFNDPPFTSGLEDAVFLNNPPDRRDAVKQVGWTTVRIDSQNPDRIWIGGVPGVYRSDDGGQSWTRATPDDVRDVQTFSISTDSGLMCVVTGGQTRVFTLDGQ